MSIDGDTSASPAPRDQGGPCPLGVLIDPFVVYGEATECTLRGATLEGASVAINTGVAPPSATYAGTWAGAGPPGTPAPALLLVKPPDPKAPDTFTTSVEVRRLDGAPALQGWTAIRFLAWLRADGDVMAGEAQAAARRILSAAGIGPGAA